MRNVEFESASSASSSDDSSDDERYSRQNALHVQIPQLPSSRADKPQPHPAGSTASLGQSATVVYQAGDGGSVTLPPLALANRSAEETSFNGASGSLRMHTPRDGLRPATQGGDEGNLGRRGSASFRPSATMTPRDTINDEELLASTKRRAVAMNANVVASGLTSPRTLGDAQHPPQQHVTRVPTAEEELVVHRFGELRTRIPSPPVRKDLLLHRNSKEDKHFRNKMRIFGSVEEMHRVVAGGVATLVKASPTTIRCDALHPRADSAVGSPRQQPPSRGVTPQTTSPRVPLPPSVSHATHFVDLKAIERQEASWYQQQQGQDLGSSDVTQRAAATPGGRSTRCAGDNRFFLVSRSSHRDEAIANSARAHVSNVSRHEHASPREGRAETSRPSTRQVAVPVRPSASSPSRSGGLQSAAAVFGQEQPTSSAVKMTPPSRGMMSISDGLDALPCEDTAYVVTETRKFEKGTLSAVKKERIATRANLSGDLGAARAEVHTSDLLKMIFNSRIALECEVAQTLRQAADERGTEKLIADAVATGQRLAMRSANVEEFHHFLCNLLRDTELSFSESRVIFNAIDTNHSGVIDATELSEGLRLLLLDESQLILTYGKKIFSEVGRHKDTRLSFLEVQAIFFSVLEFFETDFVEADVIKAADLSNSKSGGGATSGLGGASSHLAAMLANTPSMQSPSSNNRSSGSVKMTKANILKDHQGESGASGLIRGNSMAFGSNQQSLGSVSYDISGQQVISATSEGNFAAAGPNGQLLPTEKPTIEALKKRMVAEVSVVLREAWRYSQSGQVVIPLLRSLTSALGPLLHTATCSVPTQHFNLKRSGFWKETLAAEETKYQQYLAANNLDLEQTLASGQGRRLSFGGNGVLKSQGRHRSLSRKGSSLAIGPNANSSQDAELVKDLNDISTLRRKGSSAANMLSLAAILSAPAHGAQSNASSNSPNAQSRRGSVAGAPIPPSGAPDGSNAQGGSPRGGRRQSHAQQAARDFFISSTLAAANPISYEEYEEASGDCVNVDKLQQQLRDGSLRLSQAQRSMIIQQIEQSKAALAARGQGGHRRSVASSYSTSGTTRGGGGQRGPPVTVTAPNSRTSQKESVKVRVEDDASHDDANPSKEGGASESLQSQKKKSFRNGANAPSSAVDLTEVIDPWHPKFTADVSKVMSQVRQLGAAEHNQSDYFSKQGLLYVRGPSGVVMPLVNDTTGGAAN